MAALEGAGKEVGEYSGDGQREAENSPPAVTDSVDPLVGADLEVDDASVEQEDSSDDAEPLLILYDCETTGLSIYNDHIVEIAAEVIHSTDSRNFTRLVKTSRRIQANGTTQ